MPVTKSTGSNLPPTCRARRMQPKPKPVPQTCGRQCRLSIRACMWWTVPWAARHEHRLETQPSINGFDVLLLLSYDCLQQQVSDSAATWMAPLVK